MLFIVPFHVLADSGKSTIVMDADSGRILYQKNIDQKQLIASTTKIMTCIVVLENFNIDSEIIVGDEVNGMYGTNIYIEKGEKIKVKDLLYGLMLRSGNDVAVALAANTLGENEFVNKMNEKSEQLGMKNTVFNNPHGLDDETKNYSTAYDMALLARYAFKNPVYRKIISTRKYVTKSSMKSYVWYNRMSLLGNYKYCIGGKNGYTPSAGKSLVSYAQKGDLTLMIISLNDQSIYENHKSLYNRYFLSYKNYKIVESGDMNINGADYNIKNSFIYPLTESELDNVSTLIKIEPKSLNQKVGKIEIRLNNNIIGITDIYKKTKIKKEKKSLFEKILNLFC